MSKEIVTKHVNVLLVEDNPGDVRLIQETFREGRLLNSLHIVEDGIEALSFLRQEGVHTNAPRPELILLDLNLPKKSGLEVLSEIEANGELKRIPVVILTSSKAEEDVIRSYDLNANSFVTKPVDLYQFVKALKSIEDFWLSIAKLPSG